MTKKSKVVRFLLTILCVVCLTASLFAFSACNKSANNDDEYHQIYNMYVAYAEEEGIKPKTYEEWLDSIKGATGATGAKGEQGEAGKDGTTWIVGSTIPDLNSGNLGDLYLNGVSFEIYIKSIDGWTKLGSIKGEKGDKGDKGDQGEKGDQGDQGNQGAPGEDGKDGATWLIGTGEPSSDKGVTNDIYLNTTSYDIYLKTAGGWIKLGNIKGEDGKDGVIGEDGKDGVNGEDGKDGVNGEDGKDGATWLVGTTAPAVEDGVVGDLYLNSATFEIYVKNSDGWTLLGSIMGEDGKDGVNGEDGKDGATWLIGTGEPSNINGKNDDIYLNTESYDIFQKVNGSWVKIGNIKGEQGKAGEDLTKEILTVRFNADGGKLENDIVTVLKGDSIDLPIPEKEGYEFAGWFYGEGANAGQVTSVTPISKDMLLYAKWIEAPVEAKDVTVTYYYNVNGINEVFISKEIEYGTAAHELLTYPSVNNFYFSAWYEDEEFTTKFNVNKNLTEDTKVYAKMLKKYTFEAEATDFEGKTGQGTSTNSFEEQMIMDYTFIKDGSTQTVSNGYFVRELYANGSYLDFEINAAEACDDAVIFLRVSSESYQFFTTKEKDGKVYNYLSDEEFLIYVNGDIGNAIKYGGLYMPMANTVEREDLAQNKTPFEDCFIAINVSLKAGRNVITLEVANNNNHGGTFHAEAPIIDCMYIYSGVELTMPDYKFYERENVQRG